MKKRGGPREQAGARPPPEDTESVISAFYGVADFFIARSPMFTLSRLAAWASIETEPAAGRREALRRRLCAEFSAPELHEALLFASSNPESLLAAAQDVGQLTPKISRALTRYFMRAASRETPFGTFAGISFGLITKNDLFELSAAQEYRRSTAIATCYLRRILGELAKREGVADLLSHELNSTLSLIHDQYRFVVEAAAHALPRSISVVSLTATPQLARTVELARSGITPAGLAHALQRSRFEYKDTLEFARTLRVRGFLVPSWLPSATGDGLMAKVLGEVDQFPELAGDVALLRSVQRDIAHADAALQGTSGKCYRIAAQKLEERFETRDATPALRTILLKPAARLEMSTELAGQFLAAADAVQRTTRWRRDPALAAFQVRFEARYGLRYVPLVEALDAHIGVGFDPSYSVASSNLFQNMPFANARARKASFDGFDRARQAILHETLSRGQRVHRLSEASLRSFPSNPQQELPESFAVVARLARDSEGGLLVVAPTVVSPSAASILGRFCEADPKLGEAVKRLVATEAELAGDALLVDVAFFPPDDTANIALRPVLRHLEIPYFGTSGAPPERQVPLSDLYLHIEEGRLRLYSARHGKCVKIRLTNAHNFESHSYPVTYRFFGALQTQDECALTPRWSWGALSGSAFLPRVVHGSTVLSVATWRLSNSELKQITGAGAEQAFSTLQLVRQRRELPRWLTRSEGEQRLLIDLDNELSVEEFVHSARGQTGLAVEELLPGPEQLVLQGPEGMFAAEFVVPFLRRARRPEVIASRWAPGAGSDPVARRRIPGSDWLYAKIYAAKPQLDAVLRCVRAQVVEPLLGGAAKLWFYLPYADPESHLRVRFAGDPRKLLRRVLPRLQDALEPLLRSGVVWRVQLDTYEQEEERYGGAVGVGLSEQIFHADSEATCALLDLCGTDGELRWQLALTGMLRLLECYGFDLEECAQFARASRDAYAAETGAGPVTWKAAGARYRRCAPALAALLWSPPNSDRAADDLARQILAQRSSKITPVLDELQAGVASGTVLASKATLASSFLHLHAMRMLGDSVRPQEMLLYDFMRRQCLTRLAQITGPRAAR